MYKIDFGKYTTHLHPGYLYLKDEARKEGWSGTPGLTGMIEERWGKNARLYFYYGDICGIGFKHSADFNAFCVAAGVTDQLELF